MIIWGENDKIFPVEIAETMSKQFNANSQFIKISKTKLMPHEEKPEQILDYVIPFFLNNKHNWGQTTVYLIHQTLPIRFVDKSSVGDSPI